MLSRLFNRVTRRRALAEVQEKRLELIQRIADAKTHHREWKPFQAELRKLTNIELELSR